jgi:hypothetical protein
MAIQTIASSVTATAAVAPPSRGREQEQHRKARREHDHHLELPAVVGGDHQRDCGRQRDRGQRVEPPRHAEELGHPDHREPDHRQGEWDPAQRDDHDREDDPRNRNADPGHGLAGRTAPGAARRPRRCGAVTTAPGRAPAPGRSRRRLGRLALCPRRRLQIHPSRSSLRVKWRRFHRGRP